MRKKRKHRPEEAEGEGAVADEAPAVEGDSDAAAAPAGEVETAPPEETAEDRTAAIGRERDDLLARLQRVSADYLNYQKRAQRDLEAAREFANEGLIKALLSVLDDMERALEAARNGRGEDDPLLTGMQLVHDKAIETLGRFGLSVIRAEGEPFDPALHSAVMQQPSEDHPPRTVLAELVKGYQLKGRTIRPSAVIVAAAPESDEDAQPEESEEA
jgi:molecular chaperone GrpE